MKRHEGADGGFRLGEKQKNSGLWGGRGGGLSRHFQKEHLFKKWSREVGWLRQRWNAVKIGQTAYGETLAGGGGGFWVMWVRNRGGKAARGRLPGGR